MLAQGNVPTSPGMAIDMRSLNAVIDYPARDMTITVQAGITVDALQRVLRAEGQQLPVDVPLAGTATLGGAVATNASGPRRFGHGTLRDYIIGISVATYEGNEIKAGGRVVKNVAGYDMMKLYNGSFGTLGIITQLTLKVKPLPEATALYLAPCPPEVTQTVTSRFLANTRTRPSIVSIANRAASKQYLGAPMSSEYLLIGLEEKKTAVDWQIGQLNQELPSELENYSSVIVGDDATATLTRWVDFPLLGDGVAFKANLLPAETVSFFRLADSTSPGPALLAHVGNGIVYGHFPADATRDQVAMAINKLLDAAVAARGNLVVTRCPADWKSSLPVWGRSTPDRKLMKAIKDKLDPGRTFNPGRFVDGI